MLNRIIIPRLDVNSEFAIFIEWCVEDGQYIKKGDVVCVLETSKSTYEIETEQNGYIFTNKNVKKGDKVKCQAVVAMVAESKEFVPKFPSNGKIMNSEESQRGIMRVTKKAQKLIDEAGLNIADIWTGKVIKERDVIRYIESSRKISITPVEDNNLVIIGAGRGGEFISQILKDHYKYNILGFLDSVLYGKVDSVCDYKVLGAITDLEAVYSKNPFFNVAVSISSDMRFRHSFYQRYSSNFNFINIIHPKAFIEGNVKMGSGNFIAANTYIGHFSVIGNNCWVAAGCIIEHHNSIGDSCLLGPSVSTSGSVVIGDRTIIGTNCCFAPKIKVENDCIINSGITVTASLEAGTELKIKKY